MPRRRKSTRARCLSRSSIASNQSVCSPCVGIRTPSTRVSITPRAHDAGRSSRSRSGRRRHSDRHRVGLRPHPARAPGEALEANDGRMEHPSRADREVSGRCLIALFPSPAQGLGVAVRGARRRDPPPAGLVAVQRGHDVHLRARPRGRAVTRQAITKHLRVMEQAGLVRGAAAGARGSGSWRRKRLEIARRYLELISTRWDSALDRLRELVEE